MHAFVGSYSEYTLAAGTQTRNGPSADEMIALVAVVALSANSSRTGPVPVVVVP